MQNKQIAVLESRSGKQIGELLTKYGATPILAPALAEIPDIDSDAIVDMIAAWQEALPNLFIFQTGVGTKALFAATDQLNLTDTLLDLLAKSKVLVRGPKPRAVLRSKKVRIDMLAGDPYTTAEVLGHVDSMDVDGKRVVVQRYGDTNVELQTALQTRGAKVLEVATYRWSLPEDTQPLTDLIARLANHSVDMACFTSASQVYNFFKVAELAGQKEALRENLNKTAIASIGPVCTNALTKYGVHIDLEASPPKLGPFITAINDYFA